MALRQKVPSSFPSIWFPRSMRSCTVYGAGVASKPAAILGNCLIAASVCGIEIAATMGTSLEQLSKTYAHLLPDSADRARVALDAYINQAAEATGRAAR